MLTINPSKRITAAEALKHPWICVCGTRTQTENIHMNRHTDINDDEKLLLVTECLSSIRSNPHEHTQLPTVFSNTHAYPIHSSHPLFHFPPNPQILSHFPCSNGPLLPPWCTGRRLWSAWRNSTPGGNSRWDVWRSVAFLILKNSPIQPSFSLPLSLCLPHSRLLRVTSKWWLAL